MLSNLYFRYGVQEFLQAVQRAGMRCYIVSAGVKAVIKQAISILEAQMSFEVKDYVVLCSSGEEYDENDYLSNFVGPLITSSTKSLLLSHSLYPEFKVNSNAIIIGDLIDDLTMATNLQLSTKLSIGMLNSNV